ncbi:MAG: hypothetical protein SFV51_09340 [Bryobacteraceae bacterium]|nr:hypothetical protein [Bryobacteraceae bacterium]
MLLGVLAAFTPAATLQKLSYEDMVLKSTEIVEGRVVASSSIVRGPVVYTVYRVQVNQKYKGTVGSEIQVAVPGGRYGNLVQDFSGSPSLVEGQNYLLFLWTSKSGLTQVIGLSQGLYRLKQGLSGEAIVSRPAATEAMLDSSGKFVEDTPVTMGYREMVEKIRRTLAVAKQ